jgi:hypothetical protein
MTTRFNSISSAILLDLLRQYFYLDPSGIFGDGGFDQGTEGIDDAALTPDDLAGVFVCDLVEDCAKLDMHGIGEFIRFLAEF